MTTIKLIQRNAFLLLCLTCIGVASSDYCIVDSNRRVEYCTWGCCGTGSSQYCCMSSFTIVGIVFGCIAFFCLALTIVICFCKHKKHRGRVVSLPSAQRINGQGDHVQSTGASSTYAVYPGYNTPYGMLYPAGPPTYSSLTFLPKQPPPYAPPSTPLPPPPAYLSPMNPFAQAAALATKT
ncbi:hypothetical protein Btru_061448 [Bulinus truncatus]|nr:hypothetical protein Btru_061448 [Bulinus truncatus]